MSDPNPKFNVKCNQINVEHKQAYIRVFNATPTVAIRGGGTEVSCSRVSAGRFLITALNGGGRKIIVNGVTPCHSAAMTAQLLSVKAVHSVVCTAENTNTTLNNKYFALPYFDYTTGKPKMCGFWFNVDAGGTQPTTAGIDKWVSVALSASDTNSTVGTAVEAAIESASDNSVDLFTSSVSTATITITDNRGGVRTSRENDAESPTTIAVTAGTSGFTASTTTAGLDGSNASAVTAQFWNSSFSATDPEAFMISLLVFNESREQ